MPTPRPPTPVTPHQPLRLTLGDIADAANTAALRMGVNPNTLGAFVAFQTVTAVRASRTSQVHPWAFITGDN